MKRAFGMLFALTIVLSLSYTLLMAEEPANNESKEAKEQKIEERRAGDEPEKISDERLTGQKRRISERQEMPYDRLFAELERQRNEIRALREEIAALRRMLENRYALRRFRQDRGIGRLEQGREPERRPSPEPREREASDIRPIEREIIRLEDEVARRPDDVELRMKLAHAYREVDRLDAAVAQYKAAMKIKPDFDPPYRALKEMGYAPDVTKEKQEPLRDSVGTVISSGAESVVLKNLEGEVVVFRVPSWQKDDGSYALNEDLSKFAESLDPGARVKILWREIEGHKVIHRMEKIKE